MALFRNMKIIHKVTQVNPESFHYRVIHYSGSSFLEACFLLTAYTPFGCFETESHVVQAGPKLTM